MDIMYGWSPVSPLKGVTDGVVEEDYIARVGHGEDKVGEEEEVEAEAGLLPLEVQEAGMQLNRHFGNSSKPV